MNVIFFPVATMSNMAGVWTVTVVTCHRYIAVCLPHRVTKFANLRVARIQASHIAYWSGYLVQTAGLEHIWYLLSTVSTVDLVINKVISLSFHYIQSDRQALRYLLSCSALPSFGEYRMMLFGDKDTCVCEQLAQISYIWEWNLRSGTWCNDNHYTRFLTTPIVNSHLPACSQFSKTCICKHFKMVKSRSQVLCNIKKLSIKVPAGGPYYDSCPHRWIRPGEKNAVNMASCSL